MEKSSVKSSPEQQEKATANGNFLSSIKKLRKVTFLPGKLGGNERYSIGIFDEGMFLHVVCLLKSGNEIRFVDAERYRLANRLESIGEHDEFILEADSSAHADEPLDITEGPEDSEFMPNGLNGNGASENSEDDQNTLILQEILRKYSHKKFSVSISLSEPQIYYMNFPGDWGLKGVDLRKKIVEEIATERPYSHALDVDDFHVIRLVDGSISAIVRDSSLNVINLLERIQPGTAKKIAFVESAESSLVNLVKANYNFDFQDLNLVIYIGHEFSRIIFLKGDYIFNVSDVIEAFLDSENIANTIYSRILLEQDKMHLPTPKNILLTGEAYDAGLADYIKAKVPSRINVEYISFKKFGLAGMDPILSRFSVAMGAALRPLDNETPALYDVDLTPTSIREGQKKFKLGLEGLILIILIPIALFFASGQITRQESNLDKLHIQLQAKTSELNALEGIELLVNKEKNKMLKYDSAIGAIDAMHIGTNVWSSFLLRLVSINRQVGYIWITNVTHRKGQGVTLRGFATRRDKIPEFARAMQNTTLRMVETQEIRRRKVYQFEMMVNLDPEMVEDKAQKSTKKNR